MNNQKLNIKLVLYIFLVTILLIVGCQSISIEGAKTLTKTPVPSFIYSTFNGAIWEIDINGQKKQLLSSDNAIKMHLVRSPNHQRLAYVIPDWSQHNPNEIRELPQILFLLNTDDTKPKQLTDPFLGIRPIWIDNDTLEVWFAYKLTTATELGEGERFLLNVEIGVMTKTGSMAEAKQNILSREITPKKSPNGQWAILYKWDETNRQAYLLDKDGNKVDTIYDLEISGSVPAYWSPDSQYIFYEKTNPRLGEGDNNIYLYDLATRRTTKVTDFPEHGGYFDVAAPRWSPTGEWIFFILNSDKHTSEPCMVNVNQRKTKCFDISAKGGGFVWDRTGHYLAFTGPRGAYPLDIYVIEAEKERLFNLTQDGDEIMEDEIAP